MQKPNIQFTGLPLITNTKDLGNAGVKQIADPEWSRVVFRLSTEKSRLDNVHAWLYKNAKGIWSLYKYHESGSYSEYVVVIRFAERNDALLFKLEDAQNYDPND